MTPFTITVQLTKEEYRAFNMAYMNKFKPIYKVRGFWIYGIAFLVGIISIVLQNIGDGAPGASGFTYLLIVLPILVPIIRLIVGKKAEKAYDSNIRIQKPIDYTFSEEGVQMKGYNFDGYFKWEETNKVIRTNKFVIIFTSTASAMIVPIQYLNGEQTTFIEAFGSKEK